jgi:hypothetical protein
MASITHCWKNDSRFESFWTRARQRAYLLRHCVAAMLVCLFALTAYADTPVALQALKIERQEGALSLSADWQFEMPNVLEEALLKGITLYFVTEVDVRQERWYFYNQRVAHAERHVRLFYQPLTRRWRVTVSPQPFTASGLGVSFGQSYESAEEAFNAVRRITPWRMANLSDINLDAKPTISINFKLDLTQLPRPLQIGAAGHSDWNIAFSKTQRLELAP